jgi:hypothetical protein
VSGAELATLGRKDGWAARLAVGYDCRWAKKKKRRGWGLKERFFYFQTHSNQEFKPGFEFKHNKMMHQHVCNREFLYFIIKLRK